MNTITRARTGCWTCRARRIKCDETRPVCRRCARLNVSCGYGLRLTWHEESIARGVCHGREAVWSKHNTSGNRRANRQRSNRPQAGVGPKRQETYSGLPRSWMFLNTSVNDLELYFDLPQDDTDKRTSTGQPTLSPSLSTLAPSDTRSQYDATLMAFFEGIICSSSTLVDNAHCNPYRYLILPMALASEGLYHATLAIAANTLRLSNPTYRVPALEHHHHALGHLRGLLAQDEWTERDLDEMIGLVLMLCWFEISDSSCASWVAHLNGYQDLLRTRQNRPPRSVHSEQLSSFFNRYFAFHLVLARTAFRLDSSTLQSPPILSDPLVDDPDTIDTYMGLSPSLLLLINQVAELAWSDNDSGIGARASQLERQLEGLRQIPPPENDIHGDTECVAIAEANRLGALLLLHEVMDSRKTIERNDSSTADKEGKNRCVGRILNLILEKKANMMRTAVLPLWPLFLAGCCAPSDTERVTVLQLFGEVDGIKRFGNIAPAMEVVQMVWKQRDLDAQDEKKRKRRDMRARFEWERAMAMMGDWKLSLT
ncbi:Zn(II)2Cys6 transcription factor [Aspergillus lucknowensis]|uniref:Fungal-specific transcription factor domain-containing protein n=1 Tax=Aspergillus lucknowensis TaxID=176173 RepID=A0ABR4LNF0_9EURO